MGIVEKIKKFPLDKFKFGTHGAQGVMNTIAWILAIAIVAKPGGQSGATYFYFFLVCAPVRHCSRVILTPTDVDHFSSPYI